MPIALDQQHTASYFELCNKVMDVYTDVDGAALVSLCMNKAYLTALHMYPEPVYAID